MGAGSDYLGEIALRSKLIKKPQLAEALSLQESRSLQPKRRIGELLIESGALEARDLSNILHVQALMRAADPDIQFVMDAIQAGLVTDAEVETCMQLKAEARGSSRCCELMVESGMITEEQKNELLSQIEHRHGDGSKLVQTIRKAELGELGHEQLVALQGARLDDAKKLIRDGVRSLIHLGIISHMVHRQGDTYGLKHLAEVLGEDRREIQSAVRDLVRISILTEEKSWKGTRYRFTSEQNLRERVDILLLCINDSQHKGKIFELLLQRK